MTWIWAVVALAVMLIGSVTRLILLAVKATKQAATIDALNQVIEAHKQAYAMLDRHRARWEADRAHLDKIRVDVQNGNLDGVLAALGLRVQPREGGGAGGAQAADAGLPDRGAPDQGATFGALLSRKPG